MCDWLGAAAILGPVDTKRNRTPVVLQSRRQAHKPTMAAQGWRGLHRSLHRASWQHPQNLSARTARQSSVLLTAGLTISPKEQGHLSSGSSLLWVIQPPEKEASGNEGTESSYLSFTKPYCQKLTGPSNTHRGPRLPLLSEDGAWSYEWSRPWRRASSLALWGAIQRCVGSREWGALPVARIGLSEQEAIPRWKALLSSQLRL